METQTLSVGELKFRAMISDLMAMDKPQMRIDCPNSSKARSLRRSFYNWGKNLPGYEAKFLERIEYKVLGRTIFIEEKASWQPVEANKGDSSVSLSQGKSA